MELECVLCKQKMGSYHDNWSGGEVSYFERGISTNRFLCRHCRNHKINLMNFETDENTLTQSAEYMKKHSADKVSEIRNVVQAWIDGEEKNYFPKMQELVYYVEGPEAYLFVFRDRVVILSSVIDGMHGKTNINFDAAMLFPMGKSKCRFILFDDKEKSITDINKLYCNQGPKIKYGDANKRDSVKQLNSLNDYVPKLFQVLSTPHTYETADLYTYPMADDVIQLESSLGDYGSLGFVYKTYKEETFLFKFFYHQNQLMEEIYNYLLRRITVSEQEEEMPVPPETLVQEISSRRGNTGEGVTEGESGSFSLADEISKLKGLLDCGILTQEEFDEAKKKLIAKM